MAGLLRIVLGPILLNRDALVPAFRGSLPALYVVISFAFLAKDPERGLPLRRSPDSGRERGAFADEDLLLFS
jgi:hypothetical protein